MLDTTRTGVFACATRAHCERLPAGQQYVDLPRVGPFACPHPCGRKECLLARPEGKLPPPKPERLAVALRLAEGATAALAQARVNQPHPAPACDLPGQPDVTRQLVLGTWHRN